VPKNDPPLSFPRRGVAGGWRDVWDDPDDSAELGSQMRAAERRMVANAERLGRVWQEQIKAERHVNAASR
jgi:hypothetical protein